MTAPMIYAALVKEGGNDNPFYIYAAALPALASVLLVPLIPVPPPPIFYTRTRHSVEVSTVPVDCSLCGPARYNVT